MDDDFIQHSGNAFNGDDSEDEFVHVSYILLSLSLSCEDLINHNFPT